MAVLRAILYGLFGGVTVLFPVSSSQLLSIIGTMIAVYAAGVIASNIYTQIMALAAMNLLISRIEFPDMNYRIVHTETELIFRDSTRLH